MTSFRKIVIGGGSALRLTLGGTRDEPPHHVKFSPMYLGWVRGVEISVAFMRSDKIRHMYFPEDECHREMERGMKEDSQRRNTGTFRVSQSETICTLETSL
jgi:hypothetical protein